MEREAGSARRLNAEAHLPWTPRSAMFRIGSHWQPNTISVRPAWETFSVQRSRGAFPLDMPGMLNPQFRCVADSARATQHTRVHASSRSATATRLPFRSLPTHAHNGLTSRLSNVATAAGLQTFTNSARIRAITAEHKRPWCAHSTPDPHHSGYTDGCVHSRVPRSDVCSCHAGRQAGSCGEYKAVCAVVSASSTWMSRAFGASSRRHENTIP